MIYPYTHKENKSSFCFQSLIFSAILIGDSVLPCFFTVLIGLCSLQIDKKEMDKRKVLSLRHVLMLSVALNVGLFLRLGYVGEGWRAEQSLHGFCLEEKQQNRGAPMEDFSQKVAHVSKGKLVETASSSVARSDVEDGGQRDINLDQ